MKTSDEASAAGAAEVAGLVEVMAKLRSAEGCPWDREQTWESLRRYVLEEAYELVDAVDRKDPEAVLEECGDLLLEVVFMAQIAHEDGRFGMADVARGITRKLIRRHPHVFGDQTRAADADDAFARWEAIKAAEKSGRPASADRLPRGLPALLLAMKAIERTDAGQNGERADRDAVLPALDRMNAARRAGDPEGVEEALGDLLLAVARGARADGLDPESALRGAVRRLGG
jgi:MazG family protein